MLLAQPAPPAPAFEVASVKASTRSGEGSGRESISAGPASVTMTNVKVKSIVQWAYRMQAIQVIGPSWMDTDRYDLAARAAGPASNDDLRKMMQTLLADRFKLEYHTESKVLPAYVITVAKTGHKLKQSEGEGEMKVEPARGKLGVSFSHMTLAQLVEFTSSELQAVVVDETGLKGSWDFTLDMSRFASAPISSRDEAIDVIIQTVNDQLGIKIDEKKATAEMLIVDHADRAPIQN
jgi:uncharacterized protein (TIGR03435 family)